MLVTSTQPTLFPSIVLVERMLQADVLLVLNSVQLDRYHVRFKLADKNGLVTLSPSLIKAKRRAFNKIDIFEPVKWIIELKTTIRHLYKKSEHYSYTMARLDDLFVDLSYNTKNLADAGQKCMKYFCNTLMSGDTIFKNIDAINQEETTSVWMANLLRDTGATKYFQGKTGMDNYFFKPDFDGIDLYYQDYKVPEYKQRGLIFNNCVSLLDSMFMIGLEETKKLFKIGNSTRVLWV